MLIGQKPAPATPSAADAVVFDTSVATFENDVLKASMQTPVLVDFWAPWCGPCKQLMPVLEKAVQEAGGKVRMAKVNIDENPELAQALRVQSVPTVFAFFQGQPVTAFAGARPASEIKMLIDQLARMTGSPSGTEMIDVAETLKLAAAALASGDIESAQNHYAQILAQDENNLPAYGGLVRSFIACGDLEQARYMIDDAPEMIKNHPDFAAIRSALALAETVPGADACDRLRDAVEKEPDNHQARFDYALALFGAGKRGAAIDELLEIMRRNRTWEDDKARTQILQFFDAMGPTDPETAAGRRRLSALLFS